MQQAVDISAVRVPRLDDYFGLWAVEENRFRAAFDRVARMDLGLHIQQSDYEPKPVVVRHASSAPPAAGSHASKVAVIELTGLLVKGESSLYESTSTVRARREIRNAADDPSVGGILLVIDSPGGTAAGTADLARETLEASVKKPVFAFIEDLGASAAYYVASQTDRIYANERSALVGSIGTLMGVYDVSGAAAKEGVKALVFATGPLKGTGFPGSEVTDEQQAYLQAIVDQTQRSFDQAVREGRGLSDEDLAAVRSGAVFVAEEAQRLKLIDGVQTLDATLAELFATISEEEKSMSRSQIAQPATGLAVLNTKQPKSEEEPKKVPEEEDGEEEPKKVPEKEDGEEEPKKVPEEEDGEEEPKKDDEEASQNAGSRAEVKRYLTAFGPDGATWYAEGLTFEQAKDKQVEKLTARVAAMEATLKAVNRGEAEPVQFQSGDKDQRAAAAAKYAGHLGENLSKMAAATEAAMATGGK